MKTRVSSIVACACATLYRYLSSISVHAHVHAPHYTRNVAWPEEAFDQSPKSSSSCIYDHLEILCMDCLALHGLCSWREREGKSWVGKTCCRIAGEHSKFSWLTLKIIDTTRGQHPFRIKFCCVCTAGDDGMHQSEIYGGPRGPPNVYGLLLRPRYGHTRTKAFYDI